MALTQTIELVEDIGGTTQVVERTIPTTEFGVKVDGEILQPAITTTVEIENDGDTATPRDQCGNTERFRATNKGWTITIDGIITGSNRQGNLSLDAVKSEVANADSVQIRSDLVSGRYIVSNVIVTQANDLVSVNTDDTNGPEKAFEFQIQLGEEESD